MQSANRLLREAEMPLELLVGQGEGIIPDARRAVDTGAEAVAARSQWQQHGGDEGQ